MPGVPWDDRPAIRHRAGGTQDVDAHGPLDQARIITDAAARVEQNTEAVKPDRLACSGIGDRAGGGVDEDAAASVARRFDRPGIADAAARGEVDADEEIILVDTIVPEFVSDAGGAADVDAVGGRLVSTRRCWRGCRPPSRKTPAPLVPTIEAELVTVPAAPLMKTP